MRRQGEPTKYPGVYRVGDKEYRVRGRVVDPRTGKQKEVDRIIKGVSAQVAAHRRADLLGEVMNEESGGVSRSKVDQVADTWLELRRPSLDVSTADRYEEVIRNQLKPAFGELYCDALAAQDIQRWVNRMVLLKKDPEDEESPPKYSVETIKGWLRTLRVIMRDEPAFRRECLEARITVPEPSLDEGDDNSLTPEELARFLEVMRTKHKQHYALVATLAYTGLRFSHASALKWEDIDEEAKIIRVQRKQVRGEIGPVSRRKRAPRQYPLHPELAAILRAHRQLLLVKQNKGLEQGWCFPSRKGTLRTPSTLAKAWQACMKEAGITRRFTPHGLRRTFNDLARLAGVDPITTKALTGHVTERMREHYSSVRLDEKRAAVGGVVSLIHRQVGTEVGT